jgi:hypothetical protein
MTSDQEFPNYTSGNCCASAGHTSGERQVVARGIDHGRRDQGGGSGRRRRVGAWNVLVTVNMSARYRFLKTRMQILTSSAESTFSPSRRCPAVNVMILRFPELPFLGDERMLKLILVSPFGLSRGTRWVYPAEDEAYQSIRESLGSF